MKKLLLMLATLAPFAAQAIEAVYEVHDKQPLHDHWVKSAPEPGTLGLLILSGALSYAVARWRRR